MSLPIIACDCATLQKTVLEFMEWIELNHGKRLDQIDGYIRMPSELKAPQYFVDLSDPTSIVTKNSLSVFLIYVQKEMLSYRNYSQLDKGYGITGYKYMHKAKKIVEEKRKEEKKDDS